MPESPRPTVLILGGFLTAPPMYRPLARRLMTSGAAGVVVANVWTPDWILAMARGTGPIATRSAAALISAIRMSREGSNGAPVLIVGHSAGGFMGRLLTAPEPYPGRRFGAAAHVGAIVTLGTPHRLANGQGIGRRLNQVLASVAEASVPGSYWAPQIGYVSVASRAVVSDPRGDGRQRVADLLYRSVMGRAAVPGTEGDGLVPVASTGLDGASEIVLESFVHGPAAGRPWYGSNDAVDAWWPAALDAWHAALDFRSGLGLAADRDENASGALPLGSRGRLG